MVQKHRYEDVPEFLHNSPYIPLGTSTYSAKALPPAQPRPTVLEILKSKPTRTIALAIISLATLLSLRYHLLSIHFFDQLWGLSCYHREPVKVDTYDVDQVDWTKLAYGQYATNKDFLCNSIMMFEALHVFGTKANKMLMYPDIWNLDGEWLGDGNGEVERNLLIKARDSYNVTLTPIRLQHQHLAKFAGHNWASSYTKLLAFNQTQYSRVLMLDSDSSLLQPIDELFLVPEGPVLMPKAYWIQQPTLSSHIMVLTPSLASFSKIEKAIPKGRAGFYDMEIMNSLFGRSCLVLPHRRYALLSGEFRSDNHNAYLGSEEIWDPAKIMGEAKLVHFSDYPLDKPWQVNTEEIEASKPLCVKIEGAEDDCRAQELWLDLYAEFKSRRKASSSS